MKLRYLIVAGVSLILSLSLAHAQVPTTTVRGQLLWNGWTQFGVLQPYPAPNVQVTLLNQSIGRSWPAVTGNDGMYYFYNIPLGSYYLEVWTSNPPKGYPVAISNLPYQDLPRIPIN